MKNKMRGNALLILTALIWGGGFIAQSAGGDLVGPWTFNCLRNLVACAGLLVLMPLLDRLTGHDKNMQIDRGVLVKGGICCGIFLACASMFQQIGVTQTTVSKAGFITSMYVVLVPFLALLTGQKVKPIIGVSAIIAMIGMYFLCMSETLRITTGDTYVMICAVFFAIHILVIDHFSPMVNGVRLSCVQFFVAGVICLPMMIFYEKTSIATILLALRPVLYAGLVSSGIGYTLQIIGQKDADPSVAGLLLSLESVFSVLLGILLLHESLTARELLGCGLMFVAVLLAQIPTSDSPEASKPVS